MTVYVDHARHKLGRMVLGHMLADTPEELHSMAAAVGMRPEWFQPRSFPHYDVTLTRRAAAVRLGAVQVRNRELAQILKKLKASEVWTAWIESQTSAETTTSSQTST